MPATQTAPTTDDKPAVSKPGSDYMDDHKHLRGDANDGAEKFAHYPDAVRDDAIWLWFFTKTKCNGEHAILHKVARAIGLKDASGKEPSDQYWYQVSSGRYFRPGGDAKAFKRYVEAIRAFARRREEGGAIAFQETGNWHKVRDFIDRRRSLSATCRFGGIEGLTGSQKTACLKHYAVLNNHLETVYMEAPARCTRARFVQKLAKAYLVPDSRTSGEKELAVESFLAGNSTVSFDTSVGRARTILIDNVQRLFRPNVAPDQQPIFNYLHELQDDTGCCIILTWVPSFRKTITEKSPFWEQFLGRMGGEEKILRLDQELTRKELTAYAKAFRVADDAKALTYLAKWAGTRLGVRILMDRLEDARQLATAQKSAEIQIAHLQQVDLEPITTATLTEEDAS